MPYRPHLPTSAKIQIIDSGLYTVRRVSLPEEHTTQARDGVFLYVTFSPVS